MKNKQNKPWIVIITGPTASGKTALSELIIKEIDGEIINVDVGQFYKELSIGTAKPDWKNLPFPCHMFDVLGQPVDLSVTEYRNRVLQLCEEITQRGRVPIIVGGSLFYIKSLFFPPKEKVGPTPSSNDSGQADLPGNTQDLWSELNEIDPERAKVIHPHDRYRIVRALIIWKTTGTKPSLYKPDFTPLPYSVLLLPLLPSRRLINDRINQRTIAMISQEGWIEEAQSFYNTAWQPFIIRKGLIGYPDIFEWIANGSKSDELLDLIRVIQQKTRDYAKRQMTFWRGLDRHLSQYNDKLLHQLIINAVENVSINSFKKATQFVKNKIKPQ